MEGENSMNRCSISVQNPFALRESLQIVLEVVWPDLPPKAVPRLRSFVHRLPISILPADIPIAEEEIEGLLLCSSLFRQSRTARWLPGDLVQVMSEFERALEGA